MLVQEISVVYGVYRLTSVSDRSIEASSEREEECFEVVLCYDDLDSISMENESVQRGSRMHF